MSRLTALITRIEEVAKKFGWELEEAVSILEGKHPKLKVVDTSAVTTTNPTSSGRVAAPARPPAPPAAGSTAPTSGTAAPNNTPAVKSQG